MRVSLLLVACASAQVHHKFHDGKRLVTAKYPTLAAATEWKAASETCPVRCQWDGRKVRTEHLLKHGKMIEWVPGASPDENINRIYHKCWHEAKTGVCTCECAHWDVDDCDVGSQVCATACGQSASIMKGTPASVEDIGCFYGSDQLNDNQCLASDKPSTCTTECPATVACPTSSPTPAPTTTPTTAPTSTPTFSPTKKSEFRFTPKTNQELRDAVKEYKKFIGQTRGRYKVLDKYGEIGTWDTKFITSFGPGIISADPWGYGPTCQTWDGYNKVYPLDSSCYLDPTRNVVKTHFRHKGDLAGLLAGFDPAMVYFKGGGDPNNFVDGVLQAEWAPGIGAQEWRPSCDCRSDTWTGRKNGCGSGGPGKCKWECATCGELLPSSVAELQKQSISAVKYTGEPITPAALQHLRITKVSTPGGIGKWNTSGVKNMGSMFRMTPLFNTDLSGWDVSKVEDMSRMFDTCPHFNQPLNSWDVSRVKNLNHMFKNTFKFNQPLNQWDVSSVKTTREMFQGARVFNQPLTNWDLSHNDPDGVVASNTRNMFQYNYLMGVPAPFGWREYLIKQLRDRGLSTMGCNGRHSCNDHGLYKRLQEALI